MKIIRVAYYKVKLQGNIKLSMCTIYIFNYNNGIQSLHYIDLTLINHVTENFDIQISIWPFIIFRKTIYCLTSFFNKWRFWSISTCIHHVIDKIYIMSFYGSYSSFTTLECCCFLCIHVCLDLVTSLYFMHQLSQQWKSRDSINVIFR